MSGRLSLPTWMLTHSKQTMVAILIIWMYIVLRAVDTKERLYGQLMVII